MLRLRPLAEQTIVYSIHTRTHAMKCWSGRHRLFLSIAHQRVIRSQTCSTRVKFFSPCDKGGDSFDVEFKHAFEIMACQFMVRNACWAECDLNNLISTLARGIKTVYYDLCNGKIHTHANFFFKEIPLKKKNPTTFRWLIKTFFSFYCIMKFNRRIFFNWVYE